VTVSSTQPKHLAVGNCSSVGYTFHTRTRASWRRQQSSHLRHHTGQGQLLAGTLWHPAALAAQHTFNPPQHICSHAHFAHFAPAQYAYQQVNLSLPESHPSAHLSNNQSGQESMMCFTADRIYLWGRSFSATLCRQQRLYAVSGTGHNLIRKPTRDAAPTWTHPARTCVLHSTDYSYPSHEPCLITNAPFSPRDAHTYLSWFRAYVVLNTRAVASTLVLPTAASDRDRPTKYQ
jgi:hypothetical protein